MEEEVGSGGGGGEWRRWGVEDLEVWFAFLQECATFLMECSREKIKQAMAALLVGT